MNHVVVITGATGGIGKETAYVYAQNGYHVVLGYRNDNKKEIVDEIKKKCEEYCGQTAYCVKADVSIASECKHIIDETMKQFGRIDVVVNNAGSMQYGLLHRTRDDIYENLVKSNQSSVFYMMKYAIKEMIKQKNGSIVNVASMAGVSGAAALAVYAATKAAVIALTKSAAIENAERGIRVNAVAPGMVQTPMTETFSNEQIEGMSLQIPMKRFATAQEVAKAIYWISSNEASYVTGEVLELSGGLK